MISLSGTFFLFLKKAIVLLSGTLILFYLSLVFVTLQLVLLSPILLIEKYN